MSSHMARGVTTALKVRGSDNTQGIITELPPARSVRPAHYSKVEGTDATVPLCELNVNET